MIFVNCNITDVKADILVNSSNGIGYMGGRKGAQGVLNGVAESIQYATHGRAEKEALACAKKCKYLPRFLCGYKPGELFITNGCGLKARYIIHAVTMRFPGCHSNIETIRILLPKLLNEARILGVASMAIPLLGTGTGGIPLSSVMDLYYDYLHHIDDLKIIIANKIIDKIN